MAGKMDSTGLKYYTESTTDLFADGVLTEDVPIKVCLIKSTSELANMMDINTFPVGSIAHTAGWAYAYEKDFDGSWVSF